MIAMLNAGLEVNNYYAYEIDKYAIQTSQHNFPKIKQCGDVFKGDYTEYEGVDYLIGGSPCTHWSIAQSPDKRETTASGLGWDLFSQYVRALREAKPKYFIYENNKSMSKEIRKAITETFGFEDICINSALLSAQNRQRLYWVGKRNDDGTYSKVDVKQPEDRGILLKDVLDGMTDRDKGRCVIASTGRTTEREYFKKNQGNMSFEPVGTTKDGKSQCIRATCYKDTVRNICGNNTDRKTGVAEPVACRCRGRTDKNGNGYAKYECRDDCKSNTLDTNSTNGNMVAEPVNTTITGKSQTIKAQCLNTAVNNICKYISTFGASGVAEPVVNSIQVGALPRPNGELSTSQAFRIYDTNAKSVSLKANGGGVGGKTGLYSIPVKVGEVGNGGQGNRIYSTNGKAITQQANSGGVGSHTGLYAIPVELENGKPTKAVSGADGKTYKVHEVVDGVITIKDKTYPIKLQDGLYIIRKLTVSECKRLQTIPEWYEFPVSDTQSYKLIGNGWTCDVITHLIKATLKQ